MSFFSKKKKETNSPPTAMKAEFPPPPNQATVRLSASQGSSAPQPSIHQQVQASQPLHSLGSSAPPNMQQQQRAPLSTRPPVVNGSNNPASPRAGQSTSGTPSSSKPPSSVIYPWSQRPLHYLPASLVSSNNESRPQSPALSGGPSPAPFPRYGHSVNSINKGSSADLYIFGGLVKDVVRNDLYVLQCVPNAAGSPQPNSSAGPPGSINVGLVETKGEVPGPRVGHASVGVGNVLIVWGGDTKTDPNQMQDDGLYLLNLSTHEWTRVKIAGAAPEGRYGHAAAMVGSKFYIFGGQSDDGSFLNDMWSFDLQKLKAGNAHWTELQPCSDSSSPPKRTGHTIITFGDNIYVFGGTDGQYHYNDTWQYDTNTQTWTELSCIGYIPVPREGHSATLVDDVMYVFGGRGVDGKDLEDLAAFKITNQRWYMFQNMGPAPTGRSGHAMASWQNKVFVLGGESYTAKKTDDTHLVHILDTAKIKYPPDANRNSQAVNRKVSNNNPPLNSSPQLGEEAIRTRSASPTNRQNNQVHAPSSSFGQAMQTDAPARANNTIPHSNGLPIAADLQSQHTPPQKDINRDVAPQRPRREGDEQIRARSPIEQDPSRSRSPIEQPSMQQNGLMQANSSTATATARSRFPDFPAALPYPQQSLNAARSIDSGSKSDSPLMQSPSQMDKPGSPSGSFASSQAHSGQRSLSPSTNVQHNQFSSGSALQTNSLQQAPRQESTVIPSATESSPSWMRAALAIATQRGFLLPESEQQEADAQLTKSMAIFGSGSNTQAQKLMEALILIKQDMANVKSSMVERAGMADQSIQQANAARAIAVQEASFYRAKLAAIEGGSSNDSSKLDRERIAELERRLMAATEEKSSHDRKAQQAQAELAQEAKLRKAAEEHAQMASDRAAATESSYSRALSDYADMQRKARSFESTASGHREQITNLSSSVSKSEAEYQHLKNRLETSESSLDQYLRTLEQTQAAFNAANAQSEEMQVLWTNAREELAASQAQIASLKADLEAKSAEHSDATSRADELDRMLKTTRVEHEAMRALTSGSLSELVAAAKANRDSSSREIGSPNQSLLKAAQEETESVRALHREAVKRAEAAHSDLEDASSRHLHLEKQVLSLRSEIAALRSQLSASSRDLARLKSDLSTKDIDVSEQSRLAEASETKAVLLRSLLIDHGIPVDESDGSPRLGNSVSGGSTSEQLYRRVQELEAQLVHRTRSQRDLESAHHESRRDLEAAQQQLRHASHRQHASEEQAGHLRDELERVTSPTGRRSAQGFVDDERLVQSEAELRTLQLEHSKLQDVHTKAVQYVRGTEKMLRKMRDEVSKHKGRNEELEQQLSSEASKPELEGLRNQMAELRSFSESSAAQNEELQQRLVTVQDDFDRTLKEQQTQANSKIDLLESEMRQLQTDLTKTQADLEETLTLNDQLNEDLQAALAKSHSKDAAGEGSEPWPEAGHKLQQDLQSAQTKEEWLRRENETLELRCKQAEQRVGLLLDHIEHGGGGASSETASSAGDHHSRSSQISDFDRFDLQKQGELTSSMDSEELRTEFWRENGNSARLSNGTSSNNHGTSIGK